MHEFHETNHSVKSTSNQHDMLRIIVKDIKKDKQELTEFDLQYYKQIEDLIRVARVDYDNPDVPRLKGGGKEKRNYQQALQNNTIPPHFSETQYIAYLDFQRDSRFDYQQTQKDNPFGHKCYKAVLTYRTATRPKRSKKGTSSQQQEIVTPYHVEAAGHEDSSPQHEQSSHGKESSQPQQYEQYGQSSNHSNEASSLHSIEQPLQETSQWAHLTKEDPTWWTKDLQ